MKVGTTSSTDPQWNGPCERGEKGKNLERANACSFKAKQNKLSII